MADEQMRLDVGRLDGTGGDRWEIAFLQTRPVFDGSRSARQTRPHAGVLLRMVDGEGRRGARQECWYELSLAVR